MIDRNAPAKTITIATERLLLRPGKSSDIPDMVASLNDWAVSQWLIRPPFPYRVEDAQEFIDWTLAEQNRACPGYFVIADPVTDALRGVISLDGADEAMVEAGYWIKPGAWGNGYAGEALRALIHYGFNGRPLLRTIYAVTDPDNLRSQSVLRRAGMTLVSRGPRAQPNRRKATEELHFEIQRP